MKFIGVASVWLEELAGVRKWEGKVGLTLPEKALVWRLLEDC